MSICESNRYVNVRPTRQAIDIANRKIEWRSNSLVQRLIVSLLMSLVMPTLSAEEAKTYELAGRWISDIEATNEYLQKNEIVLSESQRKYFNGLKIGYEINDQYKAFHERNGQIKEMPAQSYLIGANHAGKNALLIGSPSRFYCLTYQFLKPDQLLVRHGSPIVLNRVASSDKKIVVDQTLRLKASKWVEKLLKGLWSYQGSTSRFYRLENNQLQAITTQNKTEFSITDVDVFATSSDIFFVDRTAYRMSFKGSRLTLESDGRKSTWHHLKDVEVIEKKIRQAFLKDLERIRAPLDPSIGASMLNQVRALAIANASGQTINSYTDMLELMRAKPEKFFKASAPFPKEFNSMSDQSKNEWLHANLKTVTCFDVPKDIVGDHVTIFEKFGPERKFAYVTLGYQKAKVLSVEKIKQMILKSTGYTYEQWLENPGRKRDPSFINK